LDVDQAFGQALRALRQARGWSQERLALEAGANRNYISLIELGQNSPSVRMVYRLCDALDYTPSGLLQDTQERVKRQSRSRNE